VIARARYSLLIAFVAFDFLVIDQVTKSLAVSHLSTETGKHVIGSFVQFQLTYNKGAAFSLGTGSTWVFTILAIVATGAVLWFAPRCKDSIWALALGILLAGVDGNLIDRLFRAPGGFQGHVVDFIALPHYPIFNVADMCINVAAALIIVQTVRGVRLNGARVEKKA
jgi:signal peptidase II